MYLATFTTKKIKVLLDQELHLLTIEPLLND